VTACDRSIAGPSSLAIASQALRMPSGNATMFIPAAATKMIAEFLIEVWQTRSHAAAEFIGRREGMDVEPLWEYSSRAAGAMKIGKYAQAWKCRARNEPGTLLIRRVWLSIASRCKNSGRRIASLRAVQKFRSTVGRETRTGRSCG
jgi:hypothetical protein